MSFKWVASKDSYIPEGAFMGGCESDGNPLFIARGYYEGGLHIGKVRHGFDGAKIPYGGDEILVKEYEVLCLDIEVDD